MTRAVTTTHADEGIVTAPDDRPLSNFVSHPRVLCLHNPYQQKCQEGHINWQLEQAYYDNCSVYESMWPQFDNGRLSCADFYNNTDRQPLWWPQLRQQVLSRMIEGASVYSVFDSIAISKEDDRDIDFYIHWQADTIKKYVEWYQGWQPQQSKTLVGLHYTGDAINQFWDPDPHIFLVNDVFSDCLWYYGKIEKYDASTDIEAKSGK